MHVDRDLVWHPACRIGIGCTRERPTHVQNARQRPRGDAEQPVIKALNESPFTDVTPRGPDGLFTTPQLHELMAILDHVRSAALAA